MHKTFVQPRALDLDLEHDIIYSITLSLSPSWSWLLSRVASRMGVPSGIERGLVLGRQQIEFRPNLKELRYGGPQHIHQGCNILTLSSSVSVRDRPTNDERCEPSRRAFYQCQWRYILIHEEMLIKRRHDYRWRRYRGRGGSGQHGKGCCERENDGELHDAMMCIDATRFDA